VTTPQVASGRKPRRKSPFSGFQHAFDGVVHVFRSQKHMRVHFFAILAILVLSIWLHLPPGDVALLVLAISMVLLAEMMNTAAEAIVDLATERYHPLAKYAKDIAAGGVLVATMGAIGIGIIVFLKDGRLQKFFVQRDVLAGDVLTYSIVGSVIVLMGVVFFKVRGGKGHVLQGGVVSAHSAMGFFLATIIFFYAPIWLVRIFALLLAAIVAQSRVEAGIHTFEEIAFGAVLGVLMATIIFKLFLNPFGAPL